LIEPPCASCAASPGWCAGGLGNQPTHLLLNREPADLHGKQAALLFTSGYISNWATLGTLASRLPGCIVLSDAANHDSMIEGIRHNQFSVDRPHPTL
jgi:5-aminolevulinate synthase